ncbi:MAG: Uma2 family endonuclease [Candidatus Kapaibacteriota bacterium]
MSALHHYKPLEASIYLHEDTYLQRELEAVEKTEYIAGILYPRWQMMAGARLMHNVLCVNMSTALRNKLRGKGCSTLSSDTRIQNPRTPAYLYPDVVVVCGKPEIQKHHSLVNPTLVVEVTSPQSFEYDRTTKLLIYDAIPSVQEYMIVSHEAQEIMLFRRDEALRLAFVEIATEQIVLTSVHCTLSIAEIYDDTDFDEIDDINEEES